MDVCLLLGGCCLLFLPRERQVGITELLGNHEVDRVRHPVHQRVQAFFQRLLTRRLSNRAVDLFDKRGRLNAEAEAHDTSQPLVELVLERRLARLLVVHLTRHKLQVAAGGGIALYQAVPVVLVSLDLVWIPLFRHRDQRFRNVALREVLQLAHLTTQGNVDCHHDLFDRRKSIHLVGADVARTIDQFVAGVVDRRNALEDLLVSRERCDRGTAMLVEDALDRCAVNRLQAVDAVAKRRANVQRWGVQHQQVFQQQTQPIVP